MRRSLVGLRVPMAVPAPGLVGKRPTFVRGCSSRRIEMGVVQDFEAEGGGGIALSALISFWPDSARDRRSPRRSMSGAAIALEAERRLEPHSVAPLGSVRFGGRWWRQRADGQARIEHHAARTDTEWRVRT